MRRVWLSKFISGIWHKEGPPDLDEVMRDLSRKINSVFGR
ncbi:MAG: protease modulator HflK N-terminal domain-containing protein, partial [Methylophilaceae bacterium]|nr:protease modulator HflK N-terminal domain-containing protein [Methylophilaceae bacterium]